VLTEFKGFLLKSSGAAEGEPDRRLQVQGLHERDLRSATIRATPAGR
jgi:hypothetical protein